MAGRHRFAGEDRTVRPLLAAVLPVIAVCGVTVAVLIGGSGSATSAPRIEVPRFSDASSPAVPSQPVALPVALPTTAPSLRDVSGSGVAAVRRLADERAEAAARAERERVAAARAAQERAAQQEAAAQRAAQERAAQERAAQERAARPQPVAPDPAPATSSEPPAAAPSQTQTPDEPAQRATPERPRGLLGSLLGG